MKEVKDFVKMMSRYQKYADVQAFGAFSATDEARMKAIKEAQDAIEESEEFQALKSLANAPFVTQIEEKKECKQHMYRGGFCLVCGEPKKQTLLQWIKQKDESFHRCSPEGVFELISEYLEQNK